jgi:ribonuclease HII
LGRLLRRERALWSEGRLRVAGVDEAGVGPLAGPVVAAAVVFPPGAGIRGVDDSKKLPPQRRLELAEEIRCAARFFALGVVEPAEIDRINIYWAALEAMRRAVTCHAIAAASILAKTHRDALMVAYDVEFPGYGFALHKGYATAAHRAALRELGPCPIHRRSFVLSPQDLNGPPLFAELVPPFLSSRDDGV